MSEIIENNRSANFFLRMHPLQRVLLSLILPAISYLIIRNKNFDWVLTITTIWDAFALSFIIFSWIVFFKRPVAQIIKQANDDDGSRAFVMISILVSSFASMFTVLLLMIAKEKSPDREIIIILLCIMGMLLSWIMVHTIFCFHYAHMYYSESLDDTVNNSALDFPGEKHPNYLDFAYFSFIIGMTFQVSDVQIYSHKIRKTVLAHSLLAFALNTFVVALTINLIAGLKH